MRSTFMIGGMVAAMLGCADPTVPSLGRPAAGAPSADQITQSAAPLVLHLVTPAATDAAITLPADNHFVWLDTTAHSRHRLLVVLPGTGQRPDQFQLVEQEGARLGYHVIGLTFVNTGGLAKICPVAADPAGCFRDTRLEIIDGVDRTPLITVSPANGIDNRLTKLLQFLVAHYPDEGWSQFINNEHRVNWPLIAVAGLSVGGGEAAMLGKIRLVDRVVMFSAVPDSIGKQAAPWVALGRTPGNRYYGLAHNRDGFFIPILAGWDSLGLKAFGAPVVVDGSTAPYGSTHMLVTGLTPQGGFVGLNAHGSTATDSFTPLALDGTPALVDAWRYMLGANPGQGDKR